MADFDLQTAKAIVLDRSLAAIDQLVLGNGEPTDIGVVGFESLGRGTAQKLPER
jgi:hypothetical protein